MRPQKDGMSNLKNRVFKNPFNQITLIYIYYYLLIIKRETPSFQEH